MNLTKEQVESATNLKCEKCGSMVFRNSYVIKVISALMMPDGKETFVPVPTFACDSCGHINAKFADDLGLQENLIKTP